MSDGKQPARVVLILEADKSEPGPPMWCVSSEDVPGLLTQGVTLAAALVNAADAVRTLGVNWRVSRE